MINASAKEKQDLMTIALFGGKRNGTYLELGGGDPIFQNNTIVLEKEFDWRGVSIDYNTGLAPLWIQHRKNPCLHVDATTIDYDKLIIEHNLGPEIDFLQLDVDGNNQALNNFSFRVLELLDLKKYTFGFITFEHNFYLDNSTKERLLSREILLNHGYTLLISDVRHGELIFEDWWINEKLMPNNNWRQLQGDKIDMVNAPPDQLLKIINLI